MHRIKSFIVFLACALALSGLAQVPVFKTFPLGEGKRTRAVQAFCQSSDNVLFFGTNEGVAKYDGLTFTDLEFAQSERPPSVTALAFDGQQVWAGSADGNLYRLEKGAFHLMELDGDTVAAKITSLLWHNERMYASTYGGGVWVIENGLKTLVNKAAGLSDDFCYTLELHAGRIWVATDAGISAIDPTTRGVVIYNTLHGLPDNIVKALSHTNDSVLTIGTYDFGVVQLNTTTGKVQSLSSESSSWQHGPVNDVVTDRNGMLWVACDDGVTTVNFADGAVFMRNYSEMNGLSSNRILKVWEDAETNVWIGTAKGASLHTGSTWEYLTTNDGLPANNIFDVARHPNGTLWLATEAAVVEFAYTGAGQPQAINHFESNGQLTRQVVTLEVAADAVWMGTYGSGLWRLAQGKAEAIAPRELGEASILDLCFDHQGNLWFATLGQGVGNVDLSTNSIHWLSDGTHLKSNYVYDVFFDSKKRIWVGTDGGGLAIYDIETSQFLPSMGGVLSEATVYAITEDAAGGIWVATAESGLWHYQKGALSQLDEKNGLRSNEVLALAPTADGGVVAVHALGADVFSLATMQAKPYVTDKDGFEFYPNLNALFFDGTEHWIGAEGGLAKLNISDAEQGPLQPKAALTALRVLYEYETLDDGKEFDYSQNHFVFDYQAIWLRAPEQVRFRYMLEGFDKQWSFETPSRTATYSSLPPGQYRFLVQATADGVNWSEPAVFSFSISKPFWMRWWFFFLLAAVLLFSIGAFTRYRTARLTADKLRLEAEVSKRTIELREQKEIVEHKNEEILSSITYAKRIQRAILPTEGEMLAALPQSFVLYMPKDIVAGDFYWLEQVDGMVIFAVADCTGHGVPGAMVSVVCHNALNRAVLEFGLRNAGAILDKTKELVVETFAHQEQFAQDLDEIKDGMDIALCVFNPTNGAFQFAGAHNPAWIIGRDENGEPICRELKPDKQPIGQYAYSKPFTTQHDQLKKGEMLYLFTDGYADQFGGPLGKKLKYAPFRKLLEGLCTLPMDQQCAQLAGQFKEWRGELEQVDDVCVFGYRG